MFNIRILVHVGLKDGSGLVSGKDYDYDGMAREFELENNFHSESNTENIINMTAKIKKNTI